ncbi:hypothetical protein K8T06_08640 [bacterium]|nr:hypothetical protein [bacterium]
MNEKKIIIIGGDHLEVQELLDRFGEERFHFEKIQIIGEDERAGEIHEFRNEPILVTHIRDMAEDGFDAAVLLSPIENLRKLTSDMVLGNVPLIDMAAQFEPSHDIPVLLPESMQQDSIKLPMISILPTGPTHAVISVLYALRETAAWKAVTGFFLQGVSTCGSRQAMDELFDQTRAILGFQEVKAEHLPHQIAFNAFHVKQSLINEQMLVACARSVIKNDLTVDIDIAWSGYFVGLIGTLWLKSDENIDLDAIRTVLSKSSGIQFKEDFGGALGVVGKDDILVEGVRTVYNDPRRLTLRFGMDNLRRGMTTSLVLLFKKTLME